MNRLKTESIYANVKKYIFGNPYDTIAIVNESPVTETISDALEEPVEYFRKKIKDGLRLTTSLETSDLVYGLGETMRGSNKRGGSYVMYNTDEPNHTDTSKSLYGAHNMVLIDGGAREAPFFLGAFFDTPSRLQFDVDLDNSGKLIVSQEHTDLRLYIFEGTSARQIARTFLHMIGRSFCPPLWAFGFGQSKWGYKNQRDIERVRNGYRQANLPLDYICLDIDYMEHYIDFTVNRSRFPNLKGLSERMKNTGVHLVPIVDAGIKIEPGNPVYEEGVEKGYFCTNEAGEAFQAAVWPGMTHLPDFSRQEVRKWFGSKYKTYTDCGISGFWNDMNEPAVFYSESSNKGSAVDTVLNAVIPSRKEITASSESHAYQAYRHMYQQPDGVQERICHHEIHNLYGAQMTQASGEGLDALLKERYLLFVRSSYIGAHRYGGIWTGDNASRWEHLRTLVCQLPNLNLCGFLFSGSDTGGFSGNCSRELMLRWLAVSAFTPLMRNHASLLSRSQECYIYRGTEDFRNIIGFRYRILPYIYSEYMKAALNGDMFIRPLSFIFPEDKKVREIEDQLMVGESIMIAPILQKGTSERSVYLPEDMTEVRYDGRQFLTEEAKAGRTTIYVQPGEIVFFIRKGKLVPVFDDELPMSTQEMNLSDVMLLGTGSFYDQYLDDGTTKNITGANIKRLAL